MEYKIVQSQDHYGLQSAVNAEIYQGFEPIGSMVIEPASTDNNGIMIFRVFYQPMVKHAVNTP